MQAAVKEVFWELKDEERLIVALSVFGGYTGEEIAGILEKNPSTIRSKYRRALKKNEREAGGMRMEHKKAIIHGMKKK